VRCYQLTFNNGDNFGYDLEALHQCDVCPTPHLEAILHKIYEKLLENFGCNFAALNLECGTHTHIHAYVQLAYPVQTMSAWQKMFPGVHVTVCFGTPDQNMDYLAKAGKWLDDAKHGTLRWGPIGVGEMLGGGAGTLEEYVELLDKKGWRYEQVIRAYPQSLRYSYGLLKFEERIRKRKQKEKQEANKPIEKEQQDDSEGNG